MERTHDCLAHVFKWTHGHAGCGCQSAWAVEILAAVLEDSPSLRDTLHAARLPVKRSGRYVQAAQLGERVVNS